MRMARLIAMAMAGVAHENTTSSLCAMAIALHHREGVPTITTKAPLGTMTLPLAEVVWKMRLKHTIGVEAVVLDVVIGTGHLETITATATETTTVGEIIGARSASASLCTDVRSSSTIDFSIVIVHQKHSEHGIG